MLMKSSANLGLGPRRCSHNCGRLLPVCFFAMEREIKSCHRYVRTGASKILQNLENLGKKVCGLETFNSHYETCLEVADFDQVRVGVKLPSK